MSDVYVVLAYRDLGDPDRRHSFDFVKACYDRQPGWTVIVSECPDSQFTRARGINEGVAQTPPGAIIVQSDPDSLVKITLLRQAIAMAREAPGLVVPHNQYMYLTEHATQRVYAGMPLSTTRAIDCHDVGPNGLGNVVVFSRDTWEQAGRYDERFGIWGGDDAAFAYACGAMVAEQRRLEGDVWHLWHERLPQSKPGHPGYHEQFAILAQYRDAAAVGPEAIRQLVESR